jgi:hypothetical protein
VALYRTEGVLPGPGILYYLSNEFYYEDVMKNSELIMAIAEKHKNDLLIGKAKISMTTSLNVTYAHVIEHMLQKKWFLELDMTYRQRREVYECIYGK